MNVHSEYLLQHEKISNLCELQQQLSLLEKQIYFKSVCNVSSTSDI